MAEKICENCYYFNDCSHNCSVFGEYVSKEDTCEGWWGFEYE